MPLIIVRDNLLNMKVDAIVNPTNSCLMTIAGIDKQIQDKEGYFFFNQAITQLGKRIPSLGDVIKFDTDKLDCKYILNVIGPKYIDGKRNEDFILRQCYKNILRKAVDENLETIAIPILSSGYYGFPKDLAIQISKEEIELFLEDYELTVYVVVYDNESYNVSLNYYKEIDDYLNKNINTNLYCTVISHNEFEEFSKVLTNKTDSFVTTLFRFIDERNLDDVDVYKRANIDRKLFSKIKCNINYKPSKQTVLAFCISLKLNIKETKELLNSAGFSLSKSFTTDLIVEFFIKRKIYNIYLINEQLFNHNEKLLGQM